jgi:hypothetical protein
VDEKGATVEVSCGIENLIELANSESSATPRCDLVQAWLPSNQVGDFAAILRADDQYAFTVWISLELSAAEKANGGTAEGPRRA